MLNSLQFIIVFFSSFFQAERTQEFRCNSISYFLLGERRVYIRVYLSPVGRRDIQELARKRLLSTQNFFRIQNFHKNCYKVLGSTRE